MPWSQHLKIPLYKSSYWSQWPNLIYYGQQANFWNFTLCGVNMHTTFQSRAMSFFQIAILWICSLAGDRHFSGTSCTSCARKPNSASHLTGSFRKMTKKVHVLLLSRVTKCHWLWKASLPIVFNFYPLQKIRHLWTLYSMTELPEKQILQQMQIQNP